MTLLQKGFSHREEAKSTKIFKKKFKKLKKLLRFLLFFLVGIKISLRSSRLPGTARQGRCRGKREVFAVDSQMAAQKAASPCIKSYLGQS